MLEGGSKGIRIDAAFPNKFAFFFSLFAYHSFSNILSHIYI